MRLFKTLKSRKARWIIGLWIGMEVLSLPAAAFVATNMSLPGFSQPAVTWVETGVPGETMLAIRSDSPVMISVTDAVGQVQVITSQAVTCLAPGTTHPRIVHQTRGPQIVSLRFDPNYRPDIRVERSVQVPLAQPCAASA
ncbi:hypothetical protein ACFFUB_03755 [Algimonas porphyrae]|uniref:Uncharacterized protein n=1 Tax=Algimonas porphyrae TaxID=1128113 RepID=A0ABQ5UXT1_9PROT|nr:hypothetical protein [Algimonas porphyrae]GLQ20118.1 hypothetical protein GCM10007854_10730 [Algimonas porphyrae]